MASPAASSAAELIFLPVDSCSIALLNARSFFRLITQLTQIDRNPGLYEDEVVPETRELFGQFLFSYRIDARTALYLGYSAGYLDELDSGLTQTGDTVFLKLSYAWQP